MRRVKRESRMPLNTVAAAKALEGRRLPPCSPSLALAALASASQAPAPSAFGALRIPGRARSRASLPSLALAALGVCFAGACRPARAFGALRIPGYGLALGRPCPRSPSPSLATESCPGGRAARACPGRCGAVSAFAPRPSARGCPGGPGCGNSGPWPPARWGSRS